MVTNRSKPSQNGEPDKLIGLLKNKYPKVGFLHVGSERKTKEGTKVPNSVDNLVYYFNNVHAYEGKTVIIGYDPTLYFRIKDVLSKITGLTVKDEESVSWKGTTIPICLVTGDVSVYRNYVPGVYKRKEAKNDVKST